MILDDSRAVYGLTLGLGLGLCFGMLIGPKIRTISRRFFSSKIDVKNKSRSRTNSNTSDEELPMASDFGEVKLVMVVRTDLKMGKGKMAAQCAHAAVSAYSKLQHSNPDLLQEWLMSGQPKVVTKIDSEDALIELLIKTKSMGLNYSIIRDAGRTQIAPGSTTVLGVGPALESKVNQVTGHLKLL